MRIQTVIIFQPGHIYLRYYADQDKTKLYLLQTTMLGSNNTFETATFSNVQIFNSNANNYNNNDYFDMYFMIDVDAIH